MDTQPVPPSSSPDGRSRSVGTSPWNGVPTDGETTTTGGAFDRGGNKMTRQRLGELTALEGRQVSVALHNGDRIDDVQLVSAGRNRAGTLWLFTNGADRFIAVEDIIDVWEAHTVGRSLAA